MSRLTDGVRTTVGRGDRAFVPFLAAGHPDLATSEEAMRAMAEAGADAIEIGVPYADSLADGPVVQGAYHAALARGASLSTTFELVRRLAADPAFPPIVLMVAYNVLYRTGLDRFAGRAVEAGAAAVLPPDLPVEEWCALAGALGTAGLDGIRLVAPATSAARLPGIVGTATGFVYCIARQGVTGERASLAAGLGARLAAIRALAPVPVVAGFGISTPEQARAVGQWADGAVVGSALVRALASGGVPAALELARSIRAALRGLGPVTAPAA